MKPSTFCPLDREAARRTMDLYFGPQPEPMPDFDDLHLLVASPDLDPEVAGKKALQLMDCAASCAFENAYRQTGKVQQQAMVVGHLICMSRQMLERFCQGTAPRPEPAGKKRMGKREEKAAKAP